MSDGERKHGSEHKRGDKRMRGGERMHGSEHKHGDKRMRSGAEIVYSIKYKIP